MDQHPDLVWQVLRNVCALHCLILRAHKFIPNHSIAINTPKSSVAKKSCDTCAANGRNQQFWGSQKSWSNWETASTKDKQNGTGHCVSCEAREQNSQPWAQISSVQDLISPSPPLSQGSGSFPYQKAKERCWSLWHREWIFLSCTVHRMLWKMKV